VKLPNKTGEPAAEAMERRTGAEENASQQRTRRTQSRESVSQTPERVRTTARFCRHYPRWEPDAGKPHVRFWAGTRVTRFPTAILDEACRRYQLSAEEFLEWQQALKVHGVGGLSVTRSKYYLY
jgi:Protein of unknown function (DUF1153)